MEFFLYLLALCLIAAGAVGTVIPAIPGLPLIFAGGWLIGMASDYELVSVTVVVILALLAAIGVGIDFFAQIVGAKKAGASKAGLWGAAIGTVIGVFTSLVGLVVFPLIGAVTGEILAGRDMVRAGAVGIATWIGMAVGLGIKIALAFTMMGIILVNAVVNTGVSHFFGGESESVSASADVPQAPVEAAPVEGYPAKPAGRTRPIAKPKTEAQPEVQPQIPEKIESRQPDAAEPAPQTQASSADPVANAIRENSAAGASSGEQTLPPPPGKDAMTKL